MAQFIIPTEPDNKNYRFFITLDEVEYSLSFYWNIRQELMYMDLGLSTGEPIVQGLAVVEDIPLLRNVSGVNKPLGELLVLDTASLKRPPKLGELGKEFVMYYLDGEELGIIR